jgi:hypothetical protein
LCLEPRTSIVPGGHGSRVPVCQVPRFVEWASRRPGVPDRLGWSRTVTRR